MTSAWSITAAVNPPRAAFLDLPREPVEQTRIMRAALKVFNEAPRGSITRLPFNWQADDGWKTAVMAGTASSASDDRVERFDTPQYQSVDDEQMADASCPTCVWL